MMFGIERRPGQSDLSWRRESRAAAREGARGEIVQIARLARGLLCMAFVAGASGRAASETYHCAPSGSDENPGTSAAPLRTLGAAIRRAPAGAVIRVAAGVYKEHVIIEKDVTIHGGYDPSTWNRDPGSFLTVIDGRGVVDFDHTILGADSTVLFTGAAVTRSAVLDGVTVYGPSVLVPPATEADVAAAIQTLYQASPTVSNVVVHGPERGGKIYTLRPGGRSSPLFRRCKIYGGKGTDPSQAKIHTICPWHSYPEFEECEIFGGAGSTTPYRTVIDTGNSHSKFTRCTFYPAEASLNPLAERFHLVSYLDNGSYTENTTEFYSCTFFGAHSGSRESLLFKLSYSHPVVDLSRYAIVDCDLVLGTSSGGGRNGYADVDLEPAIRAAGGRFEGNRFWPSAEAFREARGDRVPPERPSSLRVVHDE